MIQKIAMGLALASLLSVPAQAAELKVTILGVRSDAGAVMIGLYDRADRFQSAITNTAHIGLLKDKGRLVGVTMRARTGSQSVGFMQLSPGRYAVIVFHDENDNGILDEDVLGMPTEGYGFSNNAMGFFSAPSFDGAAVTVGTHDMSISIALIYPGASATRPAGK
jgi:uncharacterized protein (DUF2141 family)